MFRGHRAALRFPLALLILDASVLPACRSRPASVSLPPSTAPVIITTRAREFPVAAAELGTFLAETVKREPDLRRRIVLIARQHLGQPYRLGPLGEGGIEPYDTDPLYCLWASDCVTFVEQVWAMALSHDFDTFHETLQRIRYRDGRIGMLSRNHFTEADWNLNNAWLLADVTRDVGGPATRDYRLRVDRAAFFRKHGIGDDIPVQTIDDSYIPRDHVARIAPRLRPGDVVEFVRGTPSAPYVGHIGLLADGPRGAVHLIHSGDPQVQELPLREYLHEHRNILGIKVLRHRSDSGWTS